VTFGLHVGLGLTPQNSGLPLAVPLDRGLGFAGQVLALALADAVKLLYINSNI